MIHSENKKNKPIIKKIDFTEEKITGRAGLGLFTKYCKNIGVFPKLTRHFKKLKRNSKGFDLTDIFFQLFCYFIDGTNLHLTRFNSLKIDEAYSATIETTPESMCSTDQVKRFFNKFSHLNNFSFRWILKDLFIWRLKVLKPKVIHIYVDTMVLNNDDSFKKEGCSPTYKNVKGFQPLHFIWNGRIIDLVFRKGSKHCNHGNTVIKGVEHIIKNIRKNYDEKARIIFHFDSGFYDKSIFSFLEKKKVKYIASGKFFNSIKAKIGSFKSFETYINGKKKWKYKDFEYTSPTWNKFRRAIFTQAIATDEKQLTFSFAQSKKIIITNISKFEKKGNPENIIEMHHRQGEYELVHRKIKEFGSEKMPFKKFECNTAYYSVMVLAFFIYQSFIEDTVTPVLPEFTLKSYVTTIRRNIIDIAGKIVSSGREIILKIQEKTFYLLKLKDIWRLCNAPPLMTSA